MPTPSFADLNLSHMFDGSILSILAIGALWGFFRGVVRQILSMLALVAGGYITWSLHRQFTMNGWHGDAPLYASVAAGVAAFWILRKLLGLFTFLAAMELTGGWGMLAGLVPSGGLVWVLGLALRWLGAQGHLGDVANPNGTNPSVASSSPTAVTSLWTQARHALDSGFLGKLVGMTDPITPDSQVKLARLLVMADHRHAMERASNPEAANAALQLPQVQTLLQNPRIRSFIAQRDFAALLNDPMLGHAMQDPQVRQAVSSL